MNLHPTTTIAQQPYFYDDEGHGVELLAYEDDFVEPKKPALYAVLLINDDYTPMGFVVFVLTEYFNKTTEEAVELMLKVHEAGSAVCGIYTQDIALTKVNQVKKVAQANEHPLQCIAKELEE